MSKLAALNLLASKGSPEYIMVQKEIRDFSKSRNVYQYLVMKGSDLLCLMQSDCSKPFHETIFPDQACRIYIDCEGNIDFSPTEEDDFIAYVRHKVSEVYSVTFQSMIGDCIVLNQSRPGKVSFHFTWSFNWLSAPRQVAAFIRKAFPEPYMGITFDPNVYPCNTSTKSVRLPYCGKLPKINQRHAKDEFRCIPFRGSEIFDISIFARACVTYHSAHGDQFLAMGVVHEMPLDSIHGSFIETSDQSSDLRILDKVIQWMEIWYPCIKPTYKRMNQDMSFSFRTPMFCLQQNRFHKGNETFINGDQYGNISMRCTDADCVHKTHTFPFTVQEIIMMDHNTSL